MDYKKNHTIPKTLLNHWATNINGRKGVFVYEIIKSKQYFSSADKPKPFSFAIENYLYVPEIKGERFANLEKWKGGLETSLADFIINLKNKEKQQVVKDINQLARIILALLSLNHISNYDIALSNNYLRINPDIKRLISGKPDREVNLLVLENIINAVTEGVNNYTPIEFIVLEANEESEFIYCDRPFINKPIDDFSFVVLTNKILIAFGKSKSYSTIVYTNCDSNFVNTINEIMAERARDWIIATNEMLLNKYRSIIGSERWKDSKEKDTVEYVTVKYLKKGYLY